MKIAFWGLGSIAKRHIKNLCSILNERNQSYAIDIIRHSGKSIEDSGIKELVHEVYTEREVKKICEEEGRIYDVLFITNPTARHYETVKTGVVLAKHMFIEKPVFDRCDMDVSELKLKKDSVYYVACPLRYTSVIQFIKNNVNIKDVYSARAISSSYLPDWRPGTDYRMTYSAHKDMGGGVSIDLIHEWDYLSWLFGMPMQIFYAGGKYSELDIDSDDLAVYIGKYQDKLVEVHLDYFGRKIIRELVLFTREDTIIADIENGRVDYLKTGEEFDLSEDRDSYQRRELEHFLDMITGKCDNDNDIENAIKVLKIAEGLSCL